MNSVASSSDYASSWYGDTSESGELSGSLGPIEDTIGVNTQESYYGDWKNDKRSGNTLNC